MKKAVKGLNEDMTCRGFQYEEGKSYEMDTAELCRSGFHACENPLDCFGYYSPANSVYHEVELDEVSDERACDSKVCAKKIKIGARLSVKQICDLHFEYVKERTTSGEQGKDCSSLSAQDWSSLSARNCSSLSARDWSSLSAQDSSSLSARDCSSLSARDWSSLSARDSSSLSAGRNSVISAFNSKAKAGLGSVIAIANREWRGNDYVVTDFSAAVVDGVNLKPDTWYKVENGKFVEAEE